MLNIFPNLLTFGFFAPTILRVAVALMIGGMAYKHYAHRNALAHARFPVVGAGAWIIWLSIVVEAAVAVMLLVGYYTQVAAIVGVLIGLKHLIWHGTHPQYFIYDRPTAFFILIISLSLLISGAGALAFDLPL